MTRTRAHPHAPVSSAAPDRDKALKASEARYRRIFETAQDGILILDGLTGKIVDANPAMVKMLEHSHGHFLGRELWEIGLFEEAPSSTAGFLDLLRIAKGFIRFDELSVRSSTGRDLTVEFVSNIYAVDDQKVVQCNIREITQRRRIEAALRKSERLNRNLVEHLPHRILVKDLQSVIVFCNANYARDLNLRVEDVVGKDAFAFYPRELAEAYNADDREVMASGALKDVEERYQADGQERWVHTVKVPYRDESGKVIGVLAVFEDITEPKRLELQLRQSQKLEGIGQLAGGVAHDFNNLLTVILGYCDLATDRLRPADPLSDDIDQIRKCSERAVELTRQLLAFSRSQLLEVRALDLNALVSGVDRMLQRLIGADIDLKSVLAADLGRFLGDPGQIEQVVMNLVVNARDAMPGGGTLTLETSNVDLDAEYAGRHIAVKPGRYVMLAVTDSGFGMDEAVRSRIFEPFFTTKPQGQGTGLGLSTVYGIIKQSGGNIWCYSEPAIGTTFKVYLPRVEQESPALQAAAPSPVARGSETVLVAEDEEMVRNLVVRTLALGGYKVIATSNGAEALREFESAREPIDLLITDMIMPGISGRELAKAVAEIRPGTRTLFMSGYTGEAMLHRDTIAVGAAFLQKPFTRESLNRKVREVLDGGSGTDRNVAAA